MRLLFAAALAAAVAGCGARPKLAPLAGRVVMAGQAVAAGSVTFYPEGGGDSAVGTLGADGSFAASTYPHGDGVAPGRYKVVLDSGLAARIKKPLYADPTKTPWSVTVPDAGVSDLVLEVK